MDDKEVQHVLGYPRNEDEDGDLAFAIALQQELDEMGLEDFSSLARQDEVGRAGVGIEQRSYFDAPISSNWKVAMSDEEYARQLQAEELATSTPPMSDDDLERVLELQFHGGVHVNGAADPSGRSNGKNVMIPSVSSTFPMSRTEPLSPPSTPLHLKAPASTIPSTFGTFGSHRASNSGFSQFNYAADPQRIAQIKKDEDYALRLQMEYNNAGVGALDSLSNYSLPHRRILNTYQAGMVRDHPAPCLKI